MRIIAVSALLLTAAACEITEPCDQYVDYMCDCHLSASECDQLRAQLVGADAATQDQCEIDLSNTQAEDGDNGVTCDGDSGS
ncbi:MAG: hypothetical protein EP330_09445 [Deltaproteobacteria bacterium]|nr:MAG: hypothetical protein EP330_09445 [Deltaproteobacteria bacterium]